MAEVSAGSRIGFENGCQNILLTNVQYCSVELHPIANTWTLWWISNALSIAYCNIVILNAEYYDAFAIFFVFVNICNAISSRYLHIDSWNIVKCNIQIRNVSVCEKTTPAFQTTFLRGLLRYCRKLLGICAKHHNNIEIHLVICIGHAYLN